MIPYVTYDSFTEPQYMAIRNKNRKSEFRLLLYRCFVVFLTEFGLILSTGLTPVDRTDLRKDRRTDVAFSWINLWLSLSTFFQKREASVLTVFINVKSYLI